MHAEHIYLFRHALLRDAAYQLQLPGDRARLHALAFGVLEQIIGGPPQEQGRISPALATRPPLWAHGALALELAEHAQRAVELDAAFEPHRARYLRRAAEHAEVQYLNAHAAQLWVKVAAASPAWESAALARAGALYSESGAAAQGE